MASDLFRARQELHDKEKLEKEVANLRKQITDIKVERDNLSGRLSALLFEKAEPGAAVIVNNTAFGFIKTVHCGGDLNTQVLVKTDCENTLNCSLMDLEFVKFLDKQAQLKDFVRGHELDGLIGLVTKIEAEKDKACVLLSNGNKLSATLSNLEVLNRKL